MSLSRASVPTKPRPPSKDSAQVRSSRFQSRHARLEKQTSVENLTMGEGGASPNLLRQETRPNRFQAWQSNGQVNAVKVLAGVESIKLPVDPNIPNESRRAMLARKAKHAAIAQRIRDQTTAVKMVAKEMAGRGPPPSLHKRKLVFDALKQVILLGNDGIRKSASLRSDITTDQGSFIYTFGAGYNGQLGRKFARGQKRYSTLPERVDINIAVRNVACGGLHSSCVTDEGKVFTWGDGRMDQLGIVTDGFSKQQTPRLVHSLYGHIAIAQVACGQSHMVALSDKGSLYCWGQAKWGQLGTGERQNVKFPERVSETDVNDEPVPKFTSVACGDKHTVALAENGTVYSFGCGDHGQLGHGSQEDVLRPKRLSALEGTRITQITCGAITTAMVSEDGKIYLCGFGEEMCPSSKENFFYRPVEITLKDPVVEVACGQSHIMALTDKGDVYAWGTGTYGQLGHGIAGRLSTPRLIIYEKDIEHIYAGRYHSVALSSHGALYTWGCGESGQLGHGSDDNCFVPRLVESCLGVVVGQVSCGEHHTAVLTSTQWEKVSADVSDWAFYERLEYQKKLRLLQRTPASDYGITRKDLIRIKHEVQQHRLEQHQRRELAEAQEEEETLTDKMLIRRQQSVLQQILDAQNDVAEPEDVDSAEEEEQGEEDSSEETWSQSPNHPPSPGHSRGASRAAMTRPSSRASDMPRPRSRVSEHMQRPSTAGHITVTGVDGNQHGSGWMLTGLDHYFDNEPSNERALVLKKRKRKSRAHPAVDDSDDVLFERQRSSHAQDCAVVAVEPADITQPRAAYLKETAEMVKRVLALAAKHGQTGDEEAADVSARDVRTQRETYDQLVSERITKEKEKRSLTKLVETLQPDLPVRRKHKQYKELKKALRMKLNTVVIKIDEVEQAKRNYKLNINHLKEENFDRQLQVEALRKQCAEGTALLKKVTTEKRLAQTLLNRAENEVRFFREDIQRNKEFMAHELSKFKKVVRKHQKRNRAHSANLNKRQKAKQAKVQQRLQALRETVQKTEAAERELSEQVDRQTDRLHYYERRFQAITAATGLSSGEDIINKFSVKSEITAELKADEERKTALIEELRTKRNALQEELQQAREEFVSYSWKDVEVKQEELRRATDRCDSAKDQLDRVNEQILRLHEGVVALSEAVQLHTNSAAPIHKSAGPLQLLKYFEEQLSLIQRRARSPKPSVPPALDQTASAPHEPVEPLRVSE